MCNESLLHRRVARRLLPAISMLCLSTSTFAGPAATEPLSDAQILGIYIQVNGFDIETALLGRAQAGSEVVRNLAQHVAADHVAVRLAAYVVAEKCKVTPALPDERTAAAIDHARALGNLLALNGAEFDKAYLRQEVGFHRAAIEAVKTALVPSAKCADLHAHLEAVLPAFEHHLSQTEQLAAGVGIAK